jgi:hypothetical protein
VEEEDGEDGDGAEAVDVSAVAGRGCSPGTKGEMQVLLRRQGGMERL